MSFNTPETVPRSSAPATNPVPPASSTHLSPAQSSDFTITRVNFTYLLHQYGGVRPLFSKLMDQYTTQAHKTAAANDVLKMALELSREIREMIDMLSSEIRGNDAQDNYGSDWAVSGDEDEGDTGGSVVEVEVEVMAAEATTGDIVADWECEVEEEGGDGKSH